MSDKFKRENQILKTAAQAEGKLKKAPQSQQQQGDAFGEVGLKPPPRELPEKVDL